LLGEDEKYLYFTAQTPGFSPFAITGKAVALGNMNETQSQTFTQTNEQNNSSNTNSLEKKQKTGSSGNGSKMPGFEVFTCIISLCAGFLYKRK
jgi:hypothetical protein